MVRKEFFEDTYQDFVEHRDYWIHKREIERSGTFLCRKCKRTYIGLDAGEKINRHGKSLCRGCKYWYKIYSTRNLLLGRVDVNLWDFLSVFKTHETRVCRYCGMRECEMWRFDIRSQKGTRLLTLGVDRIDSDIGYSKGNISICCLYCNRAKSNVISESEMLEFIGPAIKAMWVKRLGY